MCREGAWNELAVRVTSGIAIRSGMLVKKSCRADMNICCTRLFLFDRKLIGEEVLEKLNDGIGIDENWNLQPYERETVTFGDGYENAEQYVA